MRSCEKNNPSRTNICFVDFGEGLKEVESEGITDWSSFKGRMHLEIYSCITKIHDCKQFYWSKLAYPLLGVFFFRFSFTKKLCNLLSILILPQAFEWDCLYLLSKGTDKFGESNNHELDVYKIIVRIIPTCFWCYSRIPCHFKQYKHIEM